MIRAVVLVSLLALSAVAATLLNQNLYERENRVDLMLSFDSTFDGRVSKTRFDNTVIVTLSNAMAENSFAQELHHEFLQKVNIERSMSDQILVTFTSDKAIDILAARTGDGYGLRLRAVAAQDPIPPVHAAVETTEVTDQEFAPQQEPTLAIETRDNLELSTSYIVTVSVLVAIAIVLFIIKRKVTTGKDNWLMPSGFSSSKPKKFDIKFQKVLDSKNKLVLMRYEDREYLTIIGNSNILLDTFENGKIASKDGFEEVFEKNKERLNDYLKIPHEDDKRSESGYNSFKANAERV